MWTADGRCAEQLQLSCKRGACLSAAYGENFTTQRSSAADADMSNHSCWQVTMMPDV
jgi:hypothetical protein